MTIAFPNPSRRYDATRRCVRFSGYDGALERPFFVQEDVIRRLAGSLLAGERDLLDAFDHHRDRIRKVAETVYGRRREGSYTLTITDFA